LKDQQFGINAAQIHSNDPGELLRLGDFAAQAEGLGFDSIWVQDSLLTDPIFLEPLTSLSYLAGKTRSIKLCVAVLLLPLRNPVVVARMASTVDFLSDHRLILGIGLGGKEEEFKASGIPLNERVTRQIEGIEVMRRLWTEEEVNFDGRFAHVVKGKMRPKPNNAVGIPIWLGGGQPGQPVKDSVLRRAAKLSDGWIGGGSTSLADFREASQKFLRYAAESGRQVKDLAVAKRVYVHVDRDSAKARQVLRVALSGMYGHEFDVEKLCVFGDAQECASRLEEFIRAGAKTLILNSVTDFFEQSAILARDVVPQVKVAKSPEI
jgi:alkanesulfonate monooxygenase SsuD/methylene tetrahydromethanopterin reductase-like flavin-dependent oxidoreductase (luciferase family)